MLIGKVSRAVAISCLEQAEEVISGSATPMVALNRRRRKTISPEKQKVVSEEKKLTILYGTKMGHALEMSRVLENRWESIHGSPNVDVVNLADFEPEDLPSLKLVVVVISTWDGGLPPESAKYFIDWLRDVSDDFRRSKTMLSNTVTGVFGLGSSAYSDDVFCTPAKEIASLFEKLHSKSAIPIGFGDDAEGDQDLDFIVWADQFISSVCGDLVKTDESGCCGGVDDDGTCGCHDDGNEVKRTKEPKLSDFNYIGDKRSNALLSKRAAKRAAKRASKKRDKAAMRRRRREAKASKEAKEEENIVTDEEDIENDLNLDIVELEERAKAAAKLRKEAAEGAHNLLGLEDDLIDDAAGELDAALALDDQEALDNAGKKNGDDGILDLEEIGKVMAAAESDRKKARNGPPRSMVTPRQRQALTKEGYKIIGTHSAVKLCRWTKNQLRGRGGCYKHTCYGITSYQCMEATPSLACANKCTFCWRHHKNPVGREWRWKTDEPEFIVDTAVKLHQQMIKASKGIPGVKPERLAEAFTVRHCALSLVGEPIMYPRINEMLAELHRREISTFLVTNAQFPECIERLAPVTQLYVSIDAATKDALKAVDRPLFKDFWERFIASLRALRKKKQRTVYRLTLLKEHNMKDVEEYSNLIRIGQPEFIEIKAVTFCGASDGSDLTFANVPYHEEVLSFSKDICKYVNSLDNCCEYGVASEHQHSNLVLLAKKKYQTPDSRWRTWIDYPKFHELVRKGEPFTADDYAALTPAWATYGAAERGMDPKEMRYYHNRTVRRAKEGKLSAQQLAQYPSDPAKFEKTQK
eukprot:g4124.t1